VRTSGSVDQWWKVLPLPRRSRGQTQATAARSQRPATRAIGVSRDFACVLNTRGFPQVFCTAPVIAILCGCINIPVAGKLMRYGADTLPHVRCM
jgi:hypothetical protein